MKPVKTISPPDWARAPEVRQVMDALNAGSQEPLALFVGGCVRNQLLNKPAEDIDVATKLKPDEVEEKLRAARVKVIPTGIDHGTVTAVAGKRNLEITTLRRDVETDGRRAVVAFSQDWREDAERRDFTLNTLLMDPDGNIFDPTGRGLADLEARRIIFVGDPAQRIAEDVLRILRFFRFHAQIGQGEPDAAALEACRAQAGKISQLSRERISQEFFKIMATNAPSKILDLMFDCNILQKLSHLNHEPEILTTLCAVQEAPEIEARLLVLAGFSMEHVETPMQDFLLFPKAMLRTMAAILAVLALPDLAEPQAVKVALYRHGRYAARQALDIEIALSCIPADFIPQARALIRDWDIPVFPVTGEDLIRQGFKPGPELGERLRAMENAWIESGFTAISPPAA